MDKAEKNRKCSETLMTRHIVWQHRSDGKNIRMDFGSIEQAQNVLETLSLHGATLTDGTTATYSLGGTIKMAL